MSLHLDLDHLELLLDLEVVDVQVNCVSGEDFLPIVLSPKTGICLNMRESMGSSADGARRDFGRLTFSAGGRGSPPGAELHCPMSTGGTFFFDQNGMRSRYFVLLIGRVEKMLQYEERREIQCKRKGR